MEVYDVLRFYSIDSLIARLELQNKVHHSDDRRYQIFSTEKYLNAWKPACLPCTAN